jgi:hypothetical protein
MAGRDVYSAELDDWKYVALWLACSVFAGREPGKPKKWNRKGMFRLIDDIEQIRTHRHNKGQPATDLDCCKELLKRPPYNKFKGNSHRPDYSASALRRRLGEARRVKRALDAMPKVGA